MAGERIQHVTIIGVGLLGGSVGLAIKARFPGVTVAGVGRRQSSLDEALRAGTVDRTYLDPAEPAAESDLVLLATPVGAFEKHLRAIQPVLRHGVAITDVGSTKEVVVRAAGRVLGAGGPFVGSHPMAGSEQKGPSFARADLFAGATCVLTPTRSTPDALTARIERFWEALGMRTVRMTPAAHDKALARVSHLPHVLASLLMMLPARGDLSVAATGFRDTTRLAGGDPEMWRDVLMTNRQAIVDAIDDMDRSLGRLRELLQAGDAAGIEKLLARAKKRRDETIGRRMIDPSQPVE